MSAENTRDDIDIFDETLQDNLDELVRDGMLEVAHDDSDPKKRVFRLTEKIITAIRRDFEAEKRSMRLSGEEIGRMLDFQRALSYSSRLLQAKIRQQESQLNYLKNLGRRMTE